MKKIVLVVALLVAFVMYLPTVKAATDEEIEQAIQDGLEWLKAQQNMTPGPNFGSWGTDGDEYPTRVARTGLAVKKFEHHALEQNILPLDPAYEYYEQVKYGLDFLFSRAAAQAIGIQMHDGNPDDPDSDGDGIGIYFVGPANGTNYETGIALMAIAESGCPDSVVEVADPPGSVLNGETYYDVVDDVVDYLAWGQNEAGSDRGGWRYEPNYSSSDQSVTGYVTLGLAYAQGPPPHGFGQTLPGFVKTELQRWIDYIQCDAAGDKFGGSGYSAPCDDYTKNMITGNLLFEMALNDQINGQAWEDAVAYIVNHWAGIPWARGYQGMYCVMKGFEFQDMPDILPNSAIDWYADLADYIVANQNTTPGPFFGSWPANLDYGDEVLTTAWALLTLEKAAPERGIVVDFDIKPQSCPNPFNTNAKGVLPVAILGTEEFDVMTVDPAMVLLEGVAPLRWAFEDVSTPVEPREDTCDCTTEGADGYMDLTLKFSRQEIFDSIAPVYDGEVRVLTLTGMTYDSTKIRGHDCVIILQKKPDRMPGQAPTLVSLAKNYPNPFNPETDISFSLPERMQVSLVIYNILGEGVKTLVNREMEAGSHSIHWNGRDEAGNSVASGIYFYRLATESFDQTMKMILMK